MPEALAAAGIEKDAVVGIGVDFTSCTILPVDAAGRPLCLSPTWAARPHAWVKLWKHHAAQPQADRINALAEMRGEAFLSDYGGRTSSEWLAAKALQILEESLCRCRAASNVEAATGRGELLPPRAQHRGAGYKALSASGFFRLRSSSASSIRFCRSRIKLRGIFRRGGASAALPSRWPPGWAFRWPPVFSGITDGHPVPGRRGRGGGWSWARNLDMPHLLWTGTALRGRRGFVARHRRGVSCYEPDSASRHLRRFGELVSGSERVCPPRAEPAVSAGGDGLLGGTGGTATVLLVAANLSGLSVHDARADGGDITGPDRSDAFSTRGSRRSRRPDPVSDFRRRRSRERIPLLVLSTDGRAGTLSRRPGTHRPWRAMLGASRPAGTGRHRVADAAARCSLNPERGRRGRVSGRRLLRSRMDTLERTTIWQVTSLRRCAGRG